MKNEGDSAKNEGDRVVADSERRSLEGRSRLLEFTPGDPILSSLFCPLFSHLSSCLIPSLFSPPLFIFSPLADAIKGDLDSLRPDVKDYYR